jgi:hypothetical protein
MDTVVRVHAHTNTLTQAQTRERARTHTQTHTPPHTHTDRHTHTHTSRPWSATNTSAALQVTLHMRTQSHMHTHAPTHAHTMCAHRRMSANMRAYVCAYSSSACMRVRVRMRAVVCVRAGGRTRERETHEFIVLHGAMPLRVGARGRAVIRDTTFRAQSGARHKYHIAVTALPQPLSEPPRPRLHIAETRGRLKLKARAARLRRVGRIRLGRTGGARGRRERSAEGAAGAGRAESRLRGERGESRGREACCATDEARQQNRSRHPGASPREVGTEMVHPPRFARPQLCTNC